MKMSNGNYNNIEDIATWNLEKMLKMEKYSSSEYQKMIQDELKFREINLSVDELENLFKHGVRRNGIVQYGEVFNI